MQRSAKVTVIDKEVLPRLQRAINQIAIDVATGNRISGGERR